MAQRMTETQTRTQFNMWSVMASPLLVLLTPGVEVRMDA